MGPNLDSLNNIAQRIEFSVKGMNVIPISRHSQKIGMILESLARVSVKEIASLTDILSRGYSIPSSVSCLYFAYYKCNQTRSARAYLKHRGIPGQFILAHKSNDLDRSDGLGEKETLYLDDILSQGIKKNEAA